MDSMRSLTVSVQIRKIAEECLEKLKVGYLDPRLDSTAPAARGNYDLIEQLFMAKVKSLLGEELEVFQGVEPSFKNLIEWFWKFYNIRVFTKRLTER